MKKGDTFYKQMNAVWVKCSVFELLRSDEKESLMIYKYLSKLNNKTWFYGLLKADDYKYFKKMGTIKLSLETYER